MQFERLSSYTGSWPPIILQFMMVILLVHSATCPIVCLIWDIEKMQIKRLTSYTTRFQVIIPEFIMILGFKKTLFRLPRRLMT